MKVVVIGGMGHIGTYLVPMLIDNGYEVTVISRGVSKPYEEHPSWEKVNLLKLDRSNDPNFAQKISNLNADVIVDLINFDVNETKKWYLL